jgi:ribulose kinase
MIGLGVVRPGKLALITGSSHLQLGVSAKPFHGKGIWGTYPDAVIPDLHIVEGGQTSTGSIVNWLKHLLPDSISYDKLNNDAKSLPPGAEGLVVLDHFQGNRTPYTDAHARGVISGLTLKHGPPISTARRSRACRSARR